MTYHNISSCQGIMQIIYINFQTYCPALVCIVPFIVDRLYRCDKVVNRRDYTYALEDSREIFWAFTTFPYKISERTVF